MKISNFENDSREKWVVILETISKTRKGNLFNSHRQKKVFHPYLGYPSMEVTMTTFNIENIDAYYHKKLNLI